MAHTSPEQMQHMIDNPNESLQSNFFAAVGAGLALSWIAVALRCVARYKSKMSFGMDDWLIIAAALAITPYTIATVVGDQGKHIIYLKSVRVFVQTVIVDIVSYAITTALTKLSILCFYCRIFPSKRLRHVAWGVGIFTISYNLAMILVASLQCIPLSSIWTGRPGTCIDLLRPLMGLGIVNIITDVTILSIPIRFVLRLHLDKTKKIQLCGIFLTGALVCVFGIIRVIAHARAAEGDPSYNQVWPGIWSECEAAVGIVAACLPTMGFFFVNKKSGPNSGLFGRVSVSLQSWLLRSRSSGKGTQNGESKPHSGVRSGDETSVTTLNDNMSIQKRVDFKVASYPSNQLPSTADHISESSSNVEDRK